MVVCNKQKYGIRKGNDGRCRQCTYVGSVRLIRYISRRQLEITLYGRRFSPAQKTQREKANVNGTARKFWRA